MNAYFTTNPTFQKKNNTAYYINSKTRYLFNVIKYSNINNYDYMSYKRSGF